MPRSYDIFGIDVSRYQGGIDWKAVAGMHEKGVRIGFAFIKATEGVGLTDPRYLKNWRLAARNGIPRGAYHYFLPDRDPAAQARLFISRVRLDPGDLPPVLDVEEQGGVPTDRLRKRVRQWLDIVERHYGIRPILYTNVRFYEQVLGNHFDAYPLWVAHYLRHERPRIAREWSFWQFSEEATVSGIRGKVDFNAFRGDTADFRRLLLP
jgi:lysozyme